MKLKTDRTLLVLFSMLDIIVEVRPVCPFFVREVRYELDVSKFGTSIGRWLSHINLNQSSASNEVTELP
jgi:hypothetical protein